MFECPPPFRSLLALAAILAASPVVAAPIAWVQMTATGAEARLVTQAPACPSIQVDGVERTMSERAGPITAFPGRVCVAALRKTDRRLAVEGQSLRAPRTRPSRVVILGDSGCRLKGLAYQSCNDPAGWPFARIAALATARKPDLVIHVGDYYYRESPCPPGNASCAGSPYGDTLATWKAELFDPARPLLAAAPWVFARGNHEDCKRGWLGWFRQLDAAPAVKACPAVAETFVVNLGGPRLVVADSSDSEDMSAPQDKVAAFGSRLDSLKSLRAGEGAWLITHRPVWNSSRLGDLVADGVVNMTERRAMKGRDLSSLALVIAGHVHNFTALGFGAARPAQLVVGTGGDTLDLEDAPPPTTGRAVIDGLKADIFSMGRFGYFVFDRHGQDWIGRFHGLDDRVAAVCLLHARALACRPA